MHRESDPVPEPPGLSCVYCGSTDTLTQDHVPPRNLFPAGTALIKVPACADCNNRASPDDELLRAAVALRKEVAENPVVSELLPKVLRGMERARAGGATRSILHSIRDVELFSPTGLYVGRGGTYEPDLQAISRAIARTVRGLYFHEFGERLPNTHGVAVFVVRYFQADLATLERLDRWVKLTTSGRIRVVHPDVFTYCVSSATDDKTSTMWLMMFYQNTPVIAGTFCKIGRPEIGELY